MITIKLYNTQKVYAAACLGIIFFGISFTVMGAVLPSMSAKYALSAVASSLLVSFLPFGLLSGSLLFGPIVDKFGYKNLFIISAILLSGGLLGLSAFNNFSMLRACIFLIGLGGGILNGVTNAIVAEIYDERKRASRLSYLGMTYGIGALAVPLVMSYLSEYYSFEIILVWTALFVLLSTVYFGIIRFPEPKFRQSFPVKDALRMIKHPTLLLISFILFFQSGLEGLVSNWSTTYLEFLQIPMSQGLKALSIHVLGITIARLILGYTLGKLRTDYILAGGLVLSFVGMLLLIYSTSFLVASVALFLLGMGLAGVFPIFIGSLGSLYKEMTGTAIGIALFIALSGNTLLNLFMGYISHRYEIESFPPFLIVCIFFQIILIVAGRKYIKQN